jgi:hypothetical protein
MKTSRQHRTEETRIAELEAKIAAIRARAERKKVKKDPSLRHISAAVRSVDKALGETNDAAMRRALDEARSTLSACLSLSGVVVAGGTRSRVRSTGGASVDEGTLLTYVRNNPGQRGEQIAQALSTDTKLMRPVMKRLIEGGKVRTRGERRGMQYAAT